MQEYCGESGDAVKCAECGAIICDQYYLSVIASQYHVTCLRCYTCSRQLSPGVTSYTRNNGIYCRQCFYRQLMSMYQCAGCHSSILPEQLVILPHTAGHVTSSSRQNVVQLYHVQCFVCADCTSYLTPGTHYGIQDGRVYCELHYCQHYQCKTNNTRPTNWLSQSFTYHPQFSDVTSRMWRSNLRAPTRGRPRKNRRLVRPEVLNINDVIVEPTKPEPVAEQMEASSLDHVMTASDVSDDAMTTQDDGNSSNGASSSTTGLWDETTTTTTTSTGGSVTRRKRIRSSFKHHQLKMMKCYFQLNHNPDAKELREISLKTGLLTRVIQVWFQNARAKFRRNQSRQHSVNRQSTVDDVTSGQLSLDDVSAQRQNDPAVTSYYQPPFLHPVSTRDVSDCCVSGLSDVTSNTDFY